MDTNAKLDGFTVHPLDLFPSNKNLNNNANKISLNTANLDGFKVHPIDLFVSHDNSPYTNYNKNNNYTILSNKPNNINIIQYTTTTTTSTKDGNIFNQYQNPNLKPYNPLMSSNTIITKEITYNYPKAVFPNNKILQNNNQINSQSFAGKSGFSYVPFPISSQSNQVTYPEERKQIIKSIQYIQPTPDNNNIIRLPKKTITTYENYSTTSNNVTYAKPYIQKYSIYSINNQAQLKISPQPQNFPIPQPQSLPKPIPQTIPQSQPQQIKTTIIYQNPPIQSYNNRGKIYITKTENFPINNPVSYNPIKTSIKNTNYITPQIQQFNPINQNNFNINQIPPTKIMNINNVNPSPSNNYFSLNSAQIVNNNNSNNGISILNRIRTTPNSIREIPYSTASYEPDTTVGDYQTRSSLVGLKSYFNTGSINIPPRSNTPIKRQFNIQNGLNPINTTIVSPNKNEIITTPKKIIILPKRTTTLFPNISTKIYPGSPKSPIITNISTSSINSPIISSNFSPVKSQVISRNIMQPLITTKRIINSPKNNIIQMSSFPLNKNNYGTTTLNRSISQGVFNIGGLSMFNNNVNVGRTISISPIKYNIPSYTQNQNNLRTIKLNNIGTTTIYNQNF